MCTCTYASLQISNLWMVCSEVSLASDSSRCVCRYVSSQVDGMHVCICAFSLYVGGQYAFMVVPGGVSNKKTTTPVHQQRWSVPAVLGDVSLLTCTCMSSG